MTRVNEIKVYCEDLVLYNNVCFFLMFISPELRLDSLFFDSQK